MALAALLLTATAVLVRFETDVEVPLDLELRLLSSEAVDVPEPMAEKEPEPTLLEIPKELAVPPESAAMSPHVEKEMPPGRDWHAQMHDVVTAAVAEQHRFASVNPAFDEKRRQAAVKFAPSKAPQKKPIWENVETDQLGRKILVSGDCYRVIDDPSAANYEIFRTFQQYIVYCSNPGTRPQEQPWVEDIRDRYGYLAQRNGAGDSARTDLSANLR